MAEQDPNIFTTDRRQEEQSWLQQRAQQESPQGEGSEALKTLLEEAPGARDSEARERISQFEVLVPEMEPMLAETDRRMAELREQGIPNPAEYDALREQLARAYEPLTSLRMDLAAIDEGAWDVSPEIRAQARGTLSELQGVFDRIEDIYQRSDRWLVEHRSELKNYGRRTTDYGAFRERHLTAELYDDQVVQLMDYVEKRIEQAVDMLAKAKRLDANDAREFLSQIDTVHEQLQKLDERTDAPQESRERRAFVGMLDRLRQRLLEYTLPELEVAEEPDPFAFAFEVPSPPIPEPKIEVEEFEGGFVARETPKPGTLAAARAMHRQVRAQYAAMQHRLREEDRRTAREKLARLKDMVRRAEHEEWERLFGPAQPVEMEEQAEIPAPQSDAVEADIQLVMARAATAAPDIAASVPMRGEVVPRRGVLASLAGAFRLK